MLDDERLLNRVDGKCGKGFIIIIHLSPSNHRVSFFIHDEIFFCSLVRYAIEGTLCVDFRYSTEPCAYICVFLWRSDGCSSRKLLKKIFAENFHGKFSFP